MKLQKVLLELRYFFSPFSREAWHNYDLRKKVETIIRDEELKNKNDHATRSKSGM